MASLTEQLLKYVFLLDDGVPMTDGAKGHSTGKSRTTRSSDAERGDLSRPERICYAVCKLASISRSSIDKPRYRFSCEKLVLNDFDYALDHEIEQKLWDAHVKVNKRYQKLLSMVILYLLFMRRRLRLRTDRHDLVMVRRRQ